MVGHQRAAWAALLPAWPEHEVIDHQLAAPGEEIGQRNPSSGRIEMVVLLHFHPGQSAPFSGEFIEQANGLFFPFQQLFARADPIVLGHDAVFPRQISFWRHQRYFVHRLDFGLAFHWAGERPASVVAG